MTMAVHYAFFKQNVICSVTVFSFLSGVSAWAVVVGAFFPLPCHISPVEHEHKASGGVNTRPIEHPQSRD